jgi:DNA replication protein DnaC
VAGVERDRTASGAGAYGGQGDASGRRRYQNTALLLIDEIGFRLVSPRYERRNIIVTTNRHVRDRPDVFAGDEILTTAILDRLLHHLHIVHIDDRDY